MTGYACVSDEKPQEAEMGLKWVDSLDIAIELDEAHPEVDPRVINFVDLRDWVLALDDFDDDPQHSGEKILEAIQAAWIEERQ
jgi:FeS assembly protein IscX